MVFKTPLLMLSDSETLERVIAKALEYKHMHPLEELIADAETIHMVHESDSPFTQAFPGENLGLDKISEDLEETLNPTAIIDKPRARYWFVRNRRFQKVVTFAATTIALGLSISALLLYKDTVTDAISGPEFSVSVDL